MKALYQLCILIGLVIKAHSGPIPPPIGKEEEDLAKDYLKRLYNMKEPRTESVGRTGSEMSKKLSEMQDFFGLEVTGTLDPETLEVMKKPRCGVPDVAAYTVVPGNYKWSKNELTYRFTRIYSGIADIMISFVVRDHGDGYPFDGPNGFLAHAFFPGPAIGGDAHFDDDESFTFSSSNGYNLFLVAAHEFGHALGLEHSRDPGALMYPTYSYRDIPTFVLPQDDVSGIQSIYGANTEKPKPTAPVTPDACDTKLVLDAVTLLRGEMLFFKDGLFWRNQPFVYQTEQHLIKSFWPEAPNNVDAAFESPSDDLVYFIKDQKVWAFHGYDIAKGYPKPLSTLGLPPKVKKITAALYDEETGKTLFFVNDRYYSYDGTTKKMDKGYPKLVDDGFPGMTGKVTAAFQYRGFTYLFSGPSMHEFGYGRLLRLCILIGLVIKAHSGPMPPSIGKEEEDLAKDYLKRLYNMKERSSQTFGRTGSEMSKKLSEMQDFFGLAVTGTLDPETLEVMKKPRCGVPDVAAYTVVPGNYRWSKNELTYRIENYSPDMSQAEVDSSIERGLKVWADVTPLRFTRIYSGVADIMISFVVR
ncbi:hypothetical protein NFI96_012655, partial [Prochilodus magdalenae]